MDPGKRHALTLRFWSPLFDFYMMRCLSRASGLILMASMVNAACNIIFDGRVPSSLRASDFDTNSSVYNDQFVHGASEIYPTLIAEALVDIHLLPSRRSNVCGHYSFPQR